MIDRLSAELRREIPDMQGLLSRNLKFMRAFAVASPDREIVQEVLAPNYLVPQHRAHRETGPSRCPPVVRPQGAGGRLEPQRAGAADRTPALLAAGKSHYQLSATQPPVESDIAAQLFKAPYFG